MVAQRRRPDKHGRIAGAAAKVPNVYCSIPGPLDGRRHGHVSGHVSAPASGDCVCNFGDSAAYPMAAFPVPEVCGRLAVTVRTATQGLFMSPIGPD